MCKAKLKLSTEKPNTFVGHSSNCLLNAVEQAEDSLTIKQLMEVVKLVKQSDRFKQSILSRAEKGSRGPTASSLMRVVIDECRELTMNDDRAGKCDVDEWRSHLAGLVVFAALMADDIGLDFEQELIDSLNELMGESKLDKTVFVIPKQDADE